MSITVTALPGPSPGDFTTYDRIAEGDRITLTLTFVATASAEAQHYSLATAVWPSPYDPAAFTVSDTAKMASTRSASRRVMALRTRITSPRKCLRACG